MPTLSVELDWTPGRQARVVLRWADRVAYVWLVDDRLAAQLSSDRTHLDQWFAERLEKLFESTFGEFGAGITEPDPPPKETHTCVWEEVVPALGPTPVYWCTLRWSTGERCRARSTLPHLVHTAEYQAQPNRAARLTEDGEEMHRCQWVLLPITERGRDGMQYGCMRTWRDGTPCGSRARRFNETYYARRTDDPA